ncbi:hypothetical protein N3C_2910 [Clostridium sp. N3C]|uniref:hypothetical protein n=1 Tax=Clostridium sp. N3C TaxID=1776758 RepID=UPI00092E14E3|nr:hypothetical protein [Clostridium sp. N3C]SCN26563.1 hypothetical protein N3C_2910 [Clostridium sp. N3C]
MAAQNYYLLTLMSVTPLASDPSNKIQTVEYNVKLTSDNSNVTDLAKANFILSSNTSIDPADWTLDTTDASNGNYSVTFESGAELDVTSYLVAYVENTGNKSDKLFVDFSQALDAQGSATYSYNVSTPGKYYFVLDSADGVVLNKESAESYDFNNPPDPNNSSIAVTFAKPYLAQIIPDPVTGLNVNVIVTLKDVNDTPLIGNNEVSFYARLES